MLRSWARALRDRLPAGATASAKELALAWGRLTAPWRMEPAFLVIGAQRCGTTSLFRALSDHPDVLRPTASKGIGFFDVNYHRGRRWYLAHFPLRLARRGKVTFESSGYYSFHPAASSRIHAELPGVKVVLMVRNPVDRAHSAHRHELARGFESLDFVEAVDAEAGRLAGEEERLLADPSHESFEHRHHAYLARGRYVEQVRRFVAELGPENVHLVDADRLFADPDTELSTLFAWLGLSAWLPQSFDQWNARPRDSMDPEVRRRLSEYFEPFDHELTEFLGRLPSWRDRSGAAPGT